MLPSVSGLTVLRGARRLRRTREVHPWRFARRPSAAEYPNRIIAGMQSNSSSQPTKASANSITQRPDALETR